MHAHAPLLLGVCSVVRMFKPKECGGEGKFKLIEEFAKNTKLKVMLSCGQCSQAAMPIDYNMIHTHCCAYISGMIVPSCFFGGIFGMRLNQLLLYNESQGHISSHRFSFIYITILVFNTQEMPIFFT